MARWDRVRQVTTFTTKALANLSVSLSFLIDFCFRNALVRDGVTIGIRMPNAAANALHNFDNAKENFARNFYSSPDIHKRLEQFGVSVISIKEQIFLRDHIGMERRTNG